MVPQPFQTELSKTLESPDFGGRSLQVVQLPIPFTGGRLYYGTGVISVIGISFTFLPVAQTSIGQMMVRLHHYAVFSLPKHQHTLLLQLGSAK